MSVTEATRFSDLSASPIRPLSQTEVKSVLSDLKDWGKEHAAIARLLGEDGPLKNFFVAAFSLSPYLRNTARIDPRLSPAELLGRADEALYYSKNNGRNQVNGFDELIMSGKLRINTPAGQAQIQSDIDEIFL